MGIAKQRSAVMIVGLLASAVFMYLAVRRLDLAQLKVVWASAHVLPWVPLGILSYICGHIVRGQRCRLLVRREANLSLMTASNIVVVGYGNSTLEDVLADVVKHNGQTLAPDPEPEKGFYFRSDHFEFAKKGVPALYLDAGTQFIGKDSTYGKTKRDEYTTKDYHKPSDEVKPDWDLSGAVEDLQVLFEVGYRVAMEKERPKWKVRPF